MKDKDDNVVTFETFASRKKEQLLSDDENFNDSIIEFIQMHIFEQCTKRGYPLSSEDTRFIQDVTIGCNIIRQAVDKLAGVSNELTEDIDDIFADSKYYKEPRQIEFDF